ELLRSFADRVVQGIGLLDAVEGDLKRNLHGFKIAGRGGPILTGVNPGAPGSRGEDALQAGKVEDADVLLVDADQALLRKATEHAAHGLELQAEVAADVGARHAQVEFRRRVAALYEAPGQAGEEGRHLL